MAVGRRLAPPRGLADALSGPRGPRGTRHQLPADAAGGADGGAADAAAAPTVAAAAPTVAAAAPTVAAAAPTVAAAGAAAVPAAAAVPSPTSPSSSGSLTAFTWDGSTVAQRVARSFSSADPAGPSGTDGLRGGGGGGRRRGDGGGDSAAADAPGQSSAETPTAAAAAVAGSGGARLDGVGPAAAEPPSPSGRMGPGASEASLDSFTIPAMHLAEMQLLRSCFLASDRGSKGYLLLPEWADMCNLMLSGAADKSAQSIDVTDAATPAAPVDDGYDDHTVLFIYEMIDSSRSGRLSLADFIFACSTFCHGTLRHKLPYVFRCFAPEGERALTEAGLRTLIEGVFTVKVAPPGHVWELSSTPPPPDRWPDSHTASGLLSVDSNPDTLWQRAKPHLTGGRMLFDGYIQWATHEPAFLLWVDWIGTRGHRAVSVIHGVDERDAFCKEMDALGLRVDQMTLNSLPLSKSTAPAQAASPHSSLSSIGRVSSTSGGLAGARPGAFEVDFAALELTTRIGEGALAEVWAGRWLEAPVAVKIFKDRSSAVAMYRLCDGIGDADDSANAGVDADDPTASASDLRRIRSDCQAGASLEAVDHLIYPCDSFASLRDASKAAGGGGIGAAPSPGSSADPSISFLQEVSVLSNLRHPNILLYMGACVRPTSPLCIISELIVGESLRARLHGPSVGSLVFTAEVRLRVSIDIARGMLYLHSRSPMLLHRGLKSSNILIESSPGSRFQVRAVLCDFGMSRTELGGTQRSMPSDGTTTADGALASMAPEVIRGERFRPAADVYGFAMVLWELWTGRVPYAGLSMMRLMVGVANKGLRPELGPDAGVPPTVAALLVRCWAEDAAARPSFLEIVRTLHRVAREEMHVTV
ncbi:hypothetical protein BU14_1872s0001 [Porphyra umbilicalis]|uniref:Protein kinase domain-containing protein n=1 Tax=Porphyra umbilicalis TaxID=2786 RepID=A0A1X6NKM8_PORUM|nr:hypothetical protein BU14_1872s0001 [Porphyra umbilicalis]|eukprot:OSX69090.1 hypothetical protein BU14_1872s0001 [Porphyra umbilicalis]